MQTKQTKEFIH